MGIVQVSIFSNPFFLPFWFFAIYLFCVRYHYFGFDLCVRVRVSIYIYIYFKSWHKAMFDFRRMGTTREVRLQRL